MAPRPTICAVRRPLQLPSGALGLMRLCTLASTHGASRHTLTTTLSSRFYKGHSQPRQQYIRMASSSAARTIHSSSTRPSPPAAAMLNPDAEHGVLSPSPGYESSKQHEEDPEPKMTPPRPSPLSVLPLTVVLRSLATTTISSSPLLLRPSLAIMSHLAHTANPLLNPDRNPLLRLLLKKTFYAQFCAGEDPAEVKGTIARLKGIGFTGVILGYAREVVLTPSQTEGLASCGEGEVAEECIRDEVVPWAEGTLQTVRLASEGDFVALKFTGAGRQALYNLSTRQRPPPALESAIDRICDLAAASGVRLLFDAEQQAVQAGIDDWTLEYMRRYNQAGGRAVVYGTYQAYLKATPDVLAAHLRAASAGGFALGVKLVRGAYLGSDPRSLMHDSKADTDAAYDGIAAAVLRRTWTGPLAGKDKDPAAAAGGKSVEFPAMDMVLASHNADSVRKGREIVEGGEARAAEVAFAQLQGMADEVSCELVAARPQQQRQAAPVRSYKYLVWGSTGECMKYLLRRAEENRDAVQRTRSGRDAMAGEVVRRVKALFGLAS